MRSATSWPAKVATGYVAEIGVMRVADEIDALDTMGIDSLAYIGSTRILADLADRAADVRRQAIVGSAASYFVIVIQIANVSAGGYLRLFWEFQVPADLQRQGDADGHLRRAGRSTATAFAGARYRSGSPPRSMIVNIVGIHFIDCDHPSLLGTNHHLPVGG